MACGPDHFGGDRCRRRDALAARSWRKLPLAAGCLLYLAYIVRVGGDFMSGRFLTAPLFLAVAVWATTTWRWPGTRPRLAQGLPGGLLGWG